jgi:hypothetical protein
LLRHDLIKPSAVNGGVAADARYLNRRSCAAHFVCQRWGGSQFHAREGAFKHSEHALKRILFNFSELLRYSTVQSINVPFLNTTERKLEVRSSHLLRVRVHFDGNDRNDNACDVGFGDERCLWRRSRLTSDLESPWDLDASHLISSTQDITLLLCR